MIKIYTGRQSSLIFLILTAGIILCLSFFVWGFTKAIEVLLPLLVLSAYLMIMVFILGIIPSSFFKDLRPSLSAYSLLLSHALGTVTWSVSFLIIIKAFGSWGLFFAFLFQFLTPLAIAGAMFKGAWSIAVNLTLWMCFIYGMKFYSRWLSRSSVPKQRKGNIIDVDVIEAENHN